MMADKGRMNKEEMTIDDEFERLRSIDAVTCQQIDRLGLTLSSHPLFSDAMARCCSHTDAGKTQCCKMI